MDKNQETFKTWNKIHLLYEEKFMDLSIYNDTYHFFCSQLPRPNSRVLELGCGPGNITRYLLQQNDNLDILGVDYSPNMIHLAQLNNPTADFQVLDAKELYKIEAKFEGIISGFLIPYFSKSELEELINNIESVLEDNGIVYISFVEGDYEKSGFQISSTGDKVYFYYHNLEEIRKQMKNNNLTELKLFRVNYNLSNREEVHTVIIAKKNAS